MTSALQEQHRAHKARLARFAQAAMRHQRPADIIIQSVPPAATVVQEEPARRREYETANQPSSYMPIATRILRSIANEFEMTVTEMLSDNRDLRFTTPRYFALGMMLEMTQMSLPAIGRRLQRDHTTIINGRKQFNKLIESEAVRNRFDQIKAEVARD